MSEGTKIEWCDHTFNPWWGCTRVSAGCAHCYAETFAARFDVGWGNNSPRRPASEKVWAQPYRWNAAAKRIGVRHRVFCSSMADVFEDRPELVGMRARLWELIKATPNLDWLLLTKRPENFLDMLPLTFGSGWPWTNVWLGVSVEDQANAEKRIPELLRVPAVVRFVSYEPALGPVDFDGGPYSESGWLKGWHCEAEADEDGDPTPTQVQNEILDWVIVGGESGPKARPFDVQWARSVVAQCHAAGVSCFVKQLGSNPRDEVPPPTLRDRKGGDMAEWPEHLRVRQFPEPRL